MNNLSGFEPETNHPPGAIETERTLAWSWTNDPCDAAALWPQAGEDGETLESREIQELLNDPEALRF